MLEKINSEELSLLFKLFKDSNKQIYLVGGTVRDLLLDKVSKDFDLCTPLRTYEIEDLLRDYFELDLYRTSLGTVIAKKNGIRFEITTFRIEKGVKNIRYPKVLKFTKSLYKDSKRRDFTFNAIYLSLNDELIDPQKGLIDLKNKNLKFIGNSKRRIKEDPLRIIRGIRFSLENNFNIDEKLYQILLINAYRVKDLKEVKYNELFKIFKNCNKKDISKYILLLSEMFKEISKSSWEFLLSDKTDNYDLRLIFIKLTDNYNLFSISKKDKKLIEEINL